MLIAQIEAASPDSSSGIERKAGRNFNSYAELALLKISAILYGSTNKKLFQ